MMNTDLTVVGTYSDRVDAEAGLRALKAVEIDAIVQGDETVGPSLRTKKHDLLVRVEDIDKASGIVGQGDHVAGGPLSEERRAAWVLKLTQDLREMRPGRRRDDPARAERITAELILLTDIDRRKPTLKKREA